MAHDNPLGQDTELDSEGISFSTAELDDIVSSADITEESGDEAEQNLEEYGIWVKVQPENVDGGSDEPAPSSELTDLEALNLSEEEEDLLSDLSSSEEASSHEIDESESAGIPTDESSDEVEIGDDIAALDLESDGSVDLDLDLPELGDDDPTAEMDFSHQEIDQAEIEAAAGQPGDPTETDSLTEPDDEDTANAGDAAFVDDAALDVPVDDLPDLALPDEDPPSTSDDFDLDIEEVGLEPTSSPVEIDLDEPSEVDTLETEDVTTDEIDLEFDGDSDGDLDEMDLGSEGDDEVIEVPLSDSAPADEDFQDIRSLEADLTTSDIAPSASAASEPMATASEDEGSMLHKIEQELQSIMTELAEVKQELAEMKGERSGGAPAPMTPADNSPGSPGFFDDDEDETIALTGDELDNILNTADITEEIAEDGATPDDLSDIDLGSLGDEPDFTLDEDEPTGISDTEEPDGSVDSAALVGDTGAGSDQADIDLSLDTDDDEPQADEISLDLDTDDDEPQADEISLDLDTDDDEPQADEISLDLDTDDDELQADEISLDLDTDDDEPQADEISLDLDTDDDQPQADELSLDLDTDDDQLQADEISLDLDTDDDQLQADEISLDLDTDDDQPQADEISLDLDTDEPDAVRESPTDDPHALESGDADGAGEGIEDDIKSVLTYLDQLLDALPEDKIEEFAQSEHFTVYKKLFEELGLEDR